MSHDLYTRLHLWLRAHRHVVLTSILLVAAVSFIVSTRIDLEEDILATLPQNDPIVDDYRYTLRKFGQVDRVYLDVGVDRPDPEALTQAADLLYEMLAAHPAFTRILYRLEIPAQNKIVEFLTGALPNLFTEEDARALETKLDPEEARSYLDVMRRKLTGPEGIMLKELVAADPVGLSALVLAKALPLQTGFDEARLEEGRIVSGDGRHVLLLAEPGFPSSNSEASENLVADLIRMARDVERRVPGARVAITGGHRMTVDNATLIKSDATRCILLGMGAMLVLCLTTYRRRWLAAVTFLPSLFGTLVAGMALALWQPHLSAIATGFAVIAIGITVDYAIHVIYHLENAPGLDRAGIGRLVGRMVLPVSVGALTTVAAFGVMTRSPMHGYQQLGLFGVIGVLCSAAFALVILPLLVPVPKQSGQTPLWLTRALDHFDAWRNRRRVWLLLAVVAVSVLSGFGAKRLRFEGDIATLNGITESTRRDEALIRETWGDALGMTLIVARGATPEEALARNDQAAKILAADPNVTGMHSLSAVCPSIATQQENARRWRAFWSSQRVAAARQTLGRIGADLGFREDAFDPFWRRIEQDPTPLTPDTFRGTPLERALYERAAFSSNDNAVSTLVKIEDATQVQRLQRALPGMIVLDHKAFAQHIAELSEKGLGQFALWTGLLVTAILYLALASVELVIATMLPLGVGILWTFGAMGWLGLPIDMMNGVFIVFIIGIGEDYSVFLVTSKLEPWRGRTHRLGATNASVMISAMTTLFGFAVLVFAKHPVLFSMGTTVLLGMASTLVATVIVTPMCMELLLFRDPPRGAPRVWHVAGAVWGGLQLAIAQVILYGILRPLLKLTTPKYADSKLRAATRWAARLIVTRFPYGNLELRNIAPSTFEPPAIVISNHQSALDVILMVALPADVRMTVKKRVWDTPILGIGCKLLGHVLVEPNDPRTTLQRCRDRLAEGASIHFFPEGTRSYDGWVLRFHRGAFDLAIELRRDILPIVICDAWTCLPRDGYWFEPYHITVLALPRVTPQNFDYARGSRELMRHCEALVRDALRRQLDQMNTPKVVRRKVERLYRYQGTFVEQFVHWKMKLDPMFPSLDGVVPRQGFILDLGCGYGLATHWLAQFTPERRVLGVDYDEDKIRVARRTAPRHERIRFEARDILNWDYPVCDAVLLLDVLHYWSVEKQRSILEKARAALRPGGRLVLRDAARAPGGAHRRVTRWERFATRVGHNKTREGLHFQSLEEMVENLRRAGFDRWEVKREAGRDSNVLLVARVEAPQCVAGSRR